MDNILFQTYKIEERSYVPFIKREIHNLVKSSFNEMRTGEIDIVISEMTSNLIKFAQRGELLYRLSMEDELPVFEALCIDNGPGIKDIKYSSRDGISSQNTLGHGLGAISRLSNVSQVYSLIDWGTIVYVKFFNDIEYQPRKKNVLVRCINVAKPGEKVCGDGVAIKYFTDKTLILVGDGLGHGEYAKEAMDKAIAAFKGSMSGDPATIIKEMHHEVKKTRGLVATVITLDHKSKQSYMCGVGNISARIQNGIDFRNYTSNNGIVGLNIPTRLENTVHSFDKLHQFVLCSDGITTKWNLMRYAGILKYDSMILSAVLYKDHARQTDDMTILIAKVL